MNEYNRLVEKYENLTDSKKRACLIYKARLSYLINEISAIPNFLELDANRIYENNFIVHKIIATNQKSKQL